MGSNEEFTQETSENAEVLVQIRNQHKGFSFRSIRSHHSYLERSQRGNRAARKSGPRLATRPGSSCRRVYHSIFSSLPPVGLSRLSPRASRHHLTPFTGNVRMQGSGLCPARGVDDQWTSLGVGFIERRQHLPAAFSSSPFCAIWPGDSSFPTIRVAGIRPGRLYSGRTGSL